MKKGELHIVLTDHLTFQGIPLDGNMDTFVYQLEKKGYSFVSDGDHVCLYEGKFANTDVSILVLTTPLSGLVHSVFVQMKEKTWNSAKATYYKFKDLLTRKYGNIIEEIEQFYDPYYDGDGYELTAIQNGCCVYSTHFKVQHGVIGVMISSNDEFDGVIMSYRDDKNSRINDGEDDQIAFDDI